MLLVSSTGVFLPLEVALNQVWGVKKNRSYLLNQAVSLGLVFAVGVLAMTSVALSALQQSILTLVFLGHVDNIVFHFLTGAMLQILAVAVGILIFFLDLLDTAQPQGARARRAAHGHRHRHSVGSGKGPLRPRPAASRLPVGLRPLLRLGHTDDVGFPLRSAAACGSTFFGYAVCSLRGPPGRTRRARSTGRRFRAVE